MSIKKDVQNAMKDALRSKDHARLDCLRMIKGALLNKEKDGSGPLTDESAIAVLRSEVRKRVEAANTFRELGKDDAAAETELEIAVIESFLPAQLSKEQIEARVRDYLDKNPDANHPGKLTGALKKELGDAADGKLLNEVCREVLGA